MFCAAPGLPAGRKEVPAGLLRSFEPGAADPELLEAHFRHSTRPGILLLGSGYLYTPWARMQREKASAPV